MNLREGPTETKTERERERDRDRETETEKEEERGKQRRTERTQLHTSYVGMNVGKERTGNRVLPGRMVRGVGRLEGDHRGEDGKVKRKKSQDGSKWRDEG